MIEIKKNTSLKNLNTFGIESFATNFIQINNENDVNNFILYFNSIPKPFFILGSGANTLFTKNYSGTVIHVNTKGISIISASNTEVLIEVQAGEEWNNLIEYCVQNNLYGIENLVAIPSTVGAAAIQNIGAYGMEAKDSIHSVNYIDLHNLTKINLNNNECNFNYRNSIFKNELKNQILITSVIFKLSKIPNLNLNYGSIKDELIKLNIQQPSLVQLTSIIRKIRETKLPDPQTVGNAGSFFKNPIVSNNYLEKLQEKFPEIVFYKINDRESKLAAAWLIDYCKLKGFQIGGAAIHQNQALVITNKNNATAKDIISLANYIQKKVLKVFNLKLQPEVIFV